MSRIKNARVLFASFLLFLTSVMVGEVSAQKTALDHYVAKPDASYTWKTVRTLKTPKLTTLVIDMTSQTWHLRRKWTAPYGSIGLSSRYQTRSHSKRECSSSLAERMEASHPTGQKNVQPRSQSPHNRLSQRCKWCRTSPLSSMATASHAWKMIWWPTLGSSFSRPATQPGRLETPWSRAPCEPWTPSRPSWPARKAEMLESTSSWSPVGQTRLDHMAHRGRR